jgi:hypothetical protein
MFNCGNYRRAVPLFVLNLIGASSAVAQDATPPVSGTDAEQQPTVLERVDVTAKREALREAMFTFVSNISIAGGSNTARWSEAICASIVGTAPEQGDFIKNRIREIATIVGAPVDEAAQCTPNLLVFLTTQPTELVAQLKARHPRLFDNLTTDEITGVQSSAQAVRIWQRSSLKNADGTPPGVAHRLIDSRILSSVSEELDAVIIVVDTASTGTVTFGQLSDYVAMVALARVDLRAELGNASTILRLFAAGNQEDNPRRLTDWDRAFLKAVYGLQDSLFRDASVVTGRMLDNLEAELRQK